MPDYDLSSIRAVSAAAGAAKIRADQEPDQSSYNAAWLHGYAEALANVAEALGPQLRGKSEQKKKRGDYHER